MFPVSFILVRYGNEAFERVPPGELAATNWIYAHDAHGARLLWLSSSTKTDVTPEMPWSYTDISRVDYSPVLAPRDPADVRDILYSLRNGGPGAYLIETRTQDTYLQQAAGYPAAGRSRSSSGCGRSTWLRVAFANSDAVIYQLRWPAGAKPYPLPPDGSGHASYPALLGGAEVLVVLATIGVLAAREFARIGRPAAASGWSAAHPGQLPVARPHPGRRGGPVRAAAIDSRGVAVRNTQPVPALILKVGQYPLHSGGVGAIRTLGRMGVPVYATAEDRFTPAAVSRVLHRHVPLAGHRPRGPGRPGWRAGRASASGSAGLAVAVPMDDEAVPCCWPSTPASCPVISCSRG